jgi:hypothetical protein
MPLAERQRLLLAYRAAVQSYHEATARFDESMFHDSLHRTEKARQKAEAARAALLKHEHLNIDALGRMPTPSEPKRTVVIGSTVALFNLSTGHWDLFEVALTGPPPTEALAYAAAPANETGQWISDAQEMDERQNEKLFFTEAGLTILREAGLEM